MQKLDQFINILNEILVYAEMESTKINSGYFSKWNQKQLENVVCPEINELGTKGSWLGYLKPAKGFRNIPDKCRGNPSAMLAGT